MARAWPLLLLATLASALPARGQAADTTAPTITAFELDVASATPTTARMIITFSEPVSGVDATDFAMNATPNAGATITGVTQGATAATYNVAFNYTGSSGSLQMAIKTSGTGITDAAGNAFVGRGIAATAAYPVNNLPPADSTLPGISSFTAPAGALTSPVQLTLVFSEPVTGVSADDFVVSPGATVGAITGSGATWTVPLSFTGSSPVSVTVIGGATSNIRDAATHWFAGGSANATVTFTPSGAGGTAPVISSPLTASVTAGAAFSYTLTATNSPTSLTATGLPAGLAFTPPTITGTVATPGVYNVTLGATNAAGSDTKTLVLTVNPAATAAPVISSPLTASVTAGAAFSYTVTATNSPTALTATGLPAGLTFTSPTITGSVATPGVYNVTLGATNAAGSDTKTLVLTVNSAGAAAPVISSPLTANVTAGAAFSYTITATNSPTALTATGLPAGLAFTSPTITGTVATPGVYNLTLGATNAAGSDSKTLVLTVLPAGGSGGTQITGVTPPANGTYGTGQTLSFTVTFSAPVTVTTTSDARPYFTWTARPGTGTTPASSPPTTNTYGVPAEFPAGHFPAAGYSRIWYPNVPPGHQPAPVKTESLSQPIPAGAWLVSRTTSNEIRLTVFHATQPGVEVAVFTFDRAGMMMTGNAGGTATPSGPSAPSGATTTGSVSYVSGSGTAVLTFSYQVKSTDWAPNGIQLGTSLQLPTGATIRDSSGNPLTGTALALPSAATSLAGVILQGSGADTPPGTPNDKQDAGKGPVTVIKRGDGLLPGRPYNLPATTATGQPITWVLVSGNATLVGNVLTPKNAGAVVVRALVSGTEVSGSTNASQSTVVTEYAIEADDPKDEKKGKSPHRDRLSNLSSRIRLSGDDANRSAIAGFVVTGNAPKQVLVRAVGPSLAAFGVNDAVPAARLELRAGSGELIAQNDGWKADADLNAAVERVGAFQMASGSRDSALLVTLPPGAYTAQVNAAGNGIALIEVYDATSAADASTEQLINISTRGQVESGDGNLIAGFVVTGDAPKRVLVRGIGAALSSFGVAGALADPVVEIYTAGGKALLARSDNWDAPQLPSAAGGNNAESISTASAAAGAFPLARGSKDAAIVLTLMPGSYSAVVSGANRATGVGLVEVYEVPNN